MPEAKVIDLLREIDKPIVVNRRKISLLEFFRFFYYEEFKHMPSLERVIQRKSVDAPVSANSDLHTAILLCLSSHLPLLIVQGG